LGAKTTPNARSGAERRRSTRTAVELRVDYSTVDAFFSDFASDINEGGMFVESESPPEVGTGVTLHFALPRRDEPLKLEGRVVWRREPSQGEPPGMGIEFDQMDRSTREQINALVRRLRSG
jgi:type IV pilus assembly protein PilZ